MLGLLVSAAFLLAALQPVEAQSPAGSPAGQWTSEGARAEVEIYPCGATGHEVSNQKMLDTLCGYVTDKGARLCGRVVKVLPKGLAELQAKGKKAEDVLAHPCCAFRVRPTRRGPGKAVSSIHGLFCQARTARGGQIEVQCLRLGRVVLSEQG